MKTGAEMVGMKVLVSWENLDAIEGIVESYPVATGDAWQIRGRNLGDPSGNEYLFFVQTYARMTVLEEK